LLVKALFCSCGTTPPARASIHIFHQEFDDMAPTRPTSFLRLPIRTIRIALLLGLIAITAGVLSSTSFASSLGSRLFARVATFVNTSQAAPSSPTVNAELEEATAITTSTTMNVERRGHTATRLADGSVLIAGGENSGGTLNQAEIYDAASGSFSAAANMVAARTAHSATLLADGRVLIAGGRNGGNAVATTEIFDPATGSFTSGPTMSVARAGHSATLFANGRVLFVGGDSAGSAEILDVMAGTSAAAGSLVTARSQHSAALLQDGRVLIVGGQDADGNALSTGEIFDTPAGTFSAVAGTLKVGRVQAHLRVLFDGKVQIIGGSNDGSMEIYDPLYEGFGAYAHVNPEGDTCAGLPGFILSSQTRAALFHNGQADPLLDRSGHTITELGGQALVLGGVNSSGVVLSSSAVVASSAAAISTDRMDYAPGETAHISGRGFQPGEVVRLKIHEDPHTPQERGFDATADAEGNFSGDYLVMGYDLDMKFLVGARGLTSGATAQTTMTDSNAFTVTPATQSVAAGSTNTFVWTFTGDNGGNVPTTTFTIPAGWTAPQAGAGPGRIIITAGTCAASLNSISGQVVTISQGPGSCTNSSTFTLTYQNATAPSPAVTTVYSFNVQNSTAPTITVTAGNVNTTTTVANATATFGDASVTLNASVTPATGPAINNGSVTFTVKQGATTIGAATTDNTVVAGAASVSYALPAGTNAGAYTIEAVYTPGAGFNGSNGSGSLTINKAASTTTINCPTNVTYNGSPQTPCTATATGAGGLNVSVTVVYGNNTNAGTATANATYAGDANHNGSTAIQVTFTIDKASSSTTINCPTNVTYNGSPQTPCTAAATGAGGLNVSVTVVYGNNTNAGTATADATYGGDANHNGSTATQVTFTIDKASSSTTINCPTNVTYNGSPQTPCTATATGAGGLNVSVTVVYANNTNAGTATADATYAGDANHNSSTATQVTFTIDKASSSTTINCPTNVIYNGSPQTPCTATATGAGGLNVSVTVVYGNNTNAGTATADATYAGDANHNSSTATQVTFTIDKASSSTTINCPTNVTYNGSPQTPCTATATGAGGLNVSVTVVYGNNTNAGTATADATYAGDANHNGSTATQVTFTIDKAGSTTTINCPTNVTYDGTPQTPCTATATGAGGLNVSVTVVYGNNTNAGIATADATYGGDANHNGSTATQVTFTIDKANSTTTINCPTNVTYDGTPQTPCTATATGAGGLNVSVTVTYGNNTNAGTATADATYVGDANHNISTATQVTFTIDKASSSTTINCPTNVTYNGSPQTPCTATATGAGGLNVSVTVVYGNNTNAGTATADATYAGDANHNSSTATQVTFTIDKAGSTTTINCPTNVTYDGTPQTPCTATATGAGGLNVSVTVVYGNNTNAGIATADATYAGDANHNGSTATQVTFTIDKAGSTTTINCPTNVTYDGTPQTPCTATATGAGGLNVSVTVVYGNNTNAGTATADATYGGDANHNGSTATQATFTIDKAGSTTTINCPTNVTYDGTPQTPCTATATGAGGLNVSVTVVYGNNTNAGTATADATYGGDANHNGSTATQVTFTIDKAGSTTTINCPTNVTYDGTPQTPCTATATGAGGLNVSVTVVYGNNTNAGIATADATYAGDANHNGSTATQVMFTIDKAGSTTTINCPTNVTYDGNPQTPCTATATGAGGLNVSVTVVYGNNTNAGTATADATYAGDANHNGSTATQVTFTIDKAGSTTTINCPTNVTYDGNPQTPCTATATGAGGLNVSVTVVYGNNTNAGIATADATHGGDANHNGSTATQATFTIDKAGSTTTINCPTNVTYDGTPQTPCTATAAGAGGLNVSVTVVYGNNTNAGVATADATYGGDANHNGSTATQVTFIIDKAGSTTTINCPTNVTYDGTPQTPCTATATGVGGLNVSVTVVYGNNTNAGIATADATYAGDANHNGSTATQVTFTIDKAGSTTTINCPTNVTYNGTPQTPCTATATGVGSLSVSVTITYTNNTDAGLATADATYAGDANHNGSTATQVTFTIDKAGSSTTINCPTNVIYNGSPQTPCTATATGVGSLSVSVTVTYTNNTDAGVATADATYGGDANHNGSTATQVTFTIDKAGSTTTINCPTNVTYNGLPQTPCTATATGVGSLSISVTVTYTNNTDAGLATADATYGGDANHNGSTATQATFTIDKAGSATTINCPTNVTYNGLPQTPCTATATGVGSLSVSVTVTYTNNTDAGLATADATYPGDANHNGSTATQATFTIDKAGSSTTINCPTNVTYNGSPQTPCTATATGVGSLSVSVTVVYGNNTNAGIATADATYSGDANHNGSTATQATFTIDKRTLTAAIAGNPTKVYDGNTTATLTPANFAISNLVSGQTLTVTKTAGTYNTKDVLTANSVSTTLVSGDFSTGPGTNLNNYNLPTSAAGAGHITAKSLAITADDKSFLFGSPVATLTASFNAFASGESVANLAGTLTFTIKNALNTTVPHNASTPSGTYAIVPAGVTSTNYNISFVNGTLTIGAWSLLGFYQPVDMSNAALVWNSIKGGSTVPLKFNIFANGVEKKALTDVQGFAVAEVPCSSSGFIADVEFTTTGGTTLRYDTSGGQFIQNWQTPKAPGKCYQTRMTALDGSHIDAYFKSK
jgi:hypothetical protein